MIKAILFDLDGTLLDTNGLIISSFKYAFKTSLNIDVDDNEIIESFGEPLETTLGRYSEEKLDELMEIYLKYNYDSHDEMTKIMDGAGDTLKTLKNKGIKLGIVTTKRESMARKGLALFNIENYFDVVITPEIVNSYKPSPEPIYGACKVLNISPSEVIMVGDSRFDILCGKNAGSKTCLVNYTLLDKEEILKYNPDYRIDKMEDILTLL